jgi:aromatic-L-amino-acid/L-tryptophan decarboxylase
MQYEDLLDWTNTAARWADKYYRTLRDRAVRAELGGPSLIEKLPEHPPEVAESMQAIFEDFEALIPGGMTHWQHPRFFAYFPSNAAPACILAEQLVSSLSAQCMLWQTSPAATELEIVMINWLRQALGLPEPFVGLIQDSATTSTLCAVLTMRERALDWQGLEHGLYASPKMRVYASAQNHSSIDKAVRLAGIGQQNLVKIATDSDLAMRADLLQQAINEDRAQGYLPIGIIGCIGGTSVGACDKLLDILEISQRENIYSHVDAAWAGSAMICPEFRPLWSGIEMADSIVVNPHKWLGANFDCSVQFLRNPQQQIKTVALRPHYLQTVEADEVTNFSEWTIPLGRRFRALKLWFVLRAYGLEGLRQRIRNHVQWTRSAATFLSQLPDFRIVTPPRLGLFTFCWSDGTPDTNASTQRLLEAINADGRTYLTQTTVDGQYAIRMSIGQFETTHQDVQIALEAIVEMAARLKVL